MTTGTLTYHRLTPKQIRIISEFVEKVTERGGERKVPLQGRIEEILGDRGEAEKTELLEGLLSNYTKVTTLTTNLLVYLIDNKNVSVTIWDMATAVDTSYGNINAWIHGTAKVLFDRRKNPHLEHVGRGTYRLVV